MKKILIISNTFSKNEGGATGVAFDQAVMLQKKGFQVSVFAGSFDSYDLGFQDVDKLKVYKVIIKNTKRYILRSWLAMKNLRIERELRIFLKDRSFDIIHFHNLYYQMPFSLIKIARKNCDKVFFTSHDVMTFSSQKLNFFVNKKINLNNVDKIDYKFSWIKQLKQDGKAFNPFRNFYIRNCLKKCIKIFVVSCELEKALNQNGILNTEVINNGIDSKDWLANKNDVENLRDKLSLRNKRVLLFAGRLSSQKGGDIIIEMLGKVKDFLPDIKLIALGGDKQYYKKILKKAEELNIKNNIILLNAISRQKMKLYYSLSDLTLVSSICLDSFPTVNLESLASKTPVISTIFGGSREVIKDKKNGFLVNPLDINDFSEKIISFFRDNNLIVNENDLVNFSKERWIEKIISFY